MPFSDDQTALLQTAVDALHTWQTTASGVNVVLQQVTMNFPGNGDGPHEVRFTWDDQVNRFDISS